jgi:glycine/D-amino acid oxidase-like deaminating enzyme
VSKRRSWRPLRGEHTADVVIVGGGLTGCATAHACAAAGFEVVLLERERLGHGSSGRGEGLLLPDPGPDFLDVSRAHGVRLARQAFEAWRRGALDAAALLRRLRVPCGLTGRRTLTVAETWAETALAREHKARRAAGAVSTWLAGRPAATAAGRPVAAAARTGAAFAFDPYRACLGLAAAAARRGAAIYEGSHARRIRARPGGVEAITPDGVVRADAVVVATGSATAEFAPLRRHFSRRERYVVMTEPVRPEIRRRLFAADTVLADRHDPSRRVHRTTDHRLVVSGAGQAETPARGRDAVLVQRTGQLMYELLTMYPDISGLAPAYGWDLQHGVTRDGLMYAGPHRNYPGHLFALGGSEASGTGAFVAARLLLRALQGAPLTADAAFAFTR